MFINKRINKMQETNKINATSITSYEDALKFLKRSDDTSKLTTCHNAKALIAMEKLITIAEAWNKADNFVPDFSNRNQYKYFPWFVYNDNAAGFVSAGTSYPASTAAAAFGSRLCFKTDERAEEFGRMFIDLWNDFLMLNK